MRSVILSLVLFFPFTVRAINVPYLSGPVVDEVSLVSAEERAILTEMLQKLHESRRAQMAILIVPDLQGEEIESYSIAVADKWALGEKGKDQGLLLVVAPKLRKMRLEVGRGLEGEIPDIIANRILVEKIGPFFREGRFGEGLMVGVEAVAERLGIDLKAPVKDRPVARKKTQENPLSVFLLVLFAFIVLFLRLFGRRRYGYWGGGGWGGGGFGGGDWGGGGGFGGGGGGFGGGGSSSSW